MVIYVSSYETAAETLSIKEWGYSKIVPKIVALELNNHTARPGRLIRYIFSQYYSLYFFLFSIMLIYGGLGFWGWGLGLGFRGREFQLMEFRAYGVGPSGFLGMGLSI